MTKSLITYSAIETACFFTSQPRSDNNGNGVSADLSLYVDKGLVGRKKLIDDLYRELQKSFEHIDGAMPAGPARKLKQVPIWVSDEKTCPLRPGEKGVVPFHRSGQWLREHGLNPHMAPGVHVINPAAVLYEEKIFEWGPMTILHELAHSYHNLHLGLSNREVLGAYRRAISRGLYLKVPDRSDPTKKVKAFAATNHEEYFAELTEAYFGRNDWYPRNRAELKSYDPGGYRMIESVWKVAAKKSGAPQLKPGGGDNAIHYPSHMAVHRPCTGRVAESIAAGHRRLTAQR